MKTWCEHITWQMRCGDGNKGHFYVDAMKEMDSPLWVPKDWNKCPYCGTLRPVEKKRLRDRFEDCKYPHIPREGSYFTVMPGQAKELADLAIDAFEDILDKVAGSMRSRYVEALYFKEKIEELLKELRGE